MFAEEQQWNRYAGWKSLSFLAAEKIYWCTAKFLELRVGTGAGEVGVAALQTIGSLVDRG